MSAPRGIAKWFLRLTGALILLCIALGVALALLLPVLLSGDAASGLIRDAARDATGSELQWTELDVSLFPPALRIEQVEARAEVLGNEPWLAAERVELHLAWLPLLARTVLVDSLEIEGIALSLRRDAEGWVIPGSETRDDASSGAPAEPAPEGAGDREISFALRTLELRNGSIRIDDRSASDVRQIELREIEARVVATSFEDPVEVLLRGELGGGAVELRGDVSAERDLALEIHFRDVAMETIQPYLQDSLALAGRATGIATLRGAAARLDRVDLVLASDDAAIASEELSASGPLELELTMDDLETPSGVFSFDATRAVLVYEVMFRKPAGVEAVAGGRFRTRADGSLDIDFDTVRIKDLGARGQLRGGPTPTLTLSTEVFELGGWDALLPALDAVPGLAGRVAIPDLEIALPSSGETPRLTGRAQLDGVQIPLPDSSDVLTLGGEVDASGDRLEGKSLLASFRGQTIPVDLRVGDLFGSPEAVLKSALDGVDANAFVGALAEKPDTLFGTLSFDADLTTPLGAATFAEALRGKVAVQVEPGRLRGVSLLQSAIDSMGPLAEAALVAGQAYGGSTLQRFFDDEFTLLRGTFDIADGRATTDDLQLLYRDYQIDLKGVVGLVEGDLDLRGVLTLFEEVDGEAAGSAQPGSGTPAERIARRVLPLAEVRGTIDRPRVAISPAVALSFATGAKSGESADGSPGKSRLEEEIDERLGEGSGQEIFNALEGLLGNGRRR